MYGRTKRIVRVAASGAVALGLGCNPDTSGQGSGPGPSPAGTTEGTGSPATGSLPPDSSGTAVADGGATSAQTTSTAGDTTGAEDSTGSCTPQPWHPDDDGDGFGDPERSTFDCRPPPNHVANDDDCDDDDGTINPNADELCNGQDDDCDDVIDEGSPNNLACGGCTFVLSNDTTRYFAVCDETTDWDAARPLCQAAFGPMAELGRIDDAVDQDALLDLIGGTDHWLSLNDLAVEGTWRWHNGDLAYDNGMPVGYDGWRPGQPGSGTGERCGELDPGGWADATCSQMQPRICEHPP